MTKYQGFVFVALLLLIALKLELIGAFMYIILLFGVIVDLLFYQRNRTR